MVNKSPDTGPKSLSWINKQIIAGHLDQAAAHLADLDTGQIEPYQLSLLRSDLAAARGDLLERLTHAAAAYSQDPDRPACYGNYALALEAAGQGALAEEVVHRAMGRAPRTPKPHLWKARLLESRGDLETALIPLHKVLKYAPKDRKNRQYRLDILVRLERFADAVDDLDILLADQPDDLDLHRMRLTLCRRLDDAPAALQSSQALISAGATPQEQQTHIELLFAADRLPEALALLEADETIGQATVATCTRVAGDLERRGRLDDAIALMEMAIRHGARPKTQVSRARLLHLRGRTEQSEMALREVIARTPKEPRAPRQLAANLLAEARPQEALSVLDAALLGMPGDISLMLARARALAALGRLDAACEIPETLRQGADLGADDALLLAKLCGDLGLREAECETLSAALQRDPKHAKLLEYVVRRAIGFAARDEIEDRMKSLESHSGKAFPDRIWRKLYMQSLDFEAAAGAARTRSSGPKTRTQASDLAKILLASHRYEVALRYLRLCRRRWPESMDFVTQSFEALIKLGRVDEARAVLADLPAGRETGFERFQVTLALYDNPGCRPDILDDPVALRNLPIKSLEVLLRNTLAQADLVTAEHLHAALIDKNAERIELRWRSSYLGQIVTEMQLLARDFEVAPEALSLPADDAELRALMRSKSWSTVLASAVITRSINSGVLKRSATRDKPQTTTPIPRIIHQYWDSEPSEAVRSLSESWAELPGYQHQMFDKATALAFLRDECGPRWVQAFRMARRPEEEADFLRLALLVRRGGIWADADDMLYGRLDRLVPPDAGLVLFREPAANAIANNFIAARPGHPVLQIAERWVMQSMLQRSNEKLWLRSGPGMMMRAVAWFIAEAGPQVAAHDLHLPGQEVLRREVSIHNRLDHKMTDKYWNSKRRRDPGYLRLIDRILAGLDLPDEPAAVGT